jgi:hypothetical protein
MQSAGRRLVRSEQQLAHAAKDSNGIRPLRQSLVDVTVRSVNSSRTVKSAQALIFGAQEALQEMNTSGNPYKARQPVEVLLQHGEDLTAQVTADMEDYPALEGEHGSQVLKQMEPMCLQLLEVAKSLGEPGADLANLMEHNLERAFEVLICLEALGFIEPLWQETVAALKHFHFLRYVTPLRASGPEGAALVIGPLLQELFRACDASLDMSEDLDEPVPMILYMSQAEAIAALSAALRMTSAECSNTQWEELTWPRFGASMELILVKNAVGDLFLQLLHDGDEYVPGLGRYLIPYEKLRDRFEACCL